MKEAPPPFKRYSAPRKKLVLIIYVIVAIITFGHSAANLTGKCGYAVCDIADKTYAGLISGSFWPLYWSWEAWS